MNNKIIIHWHDWNGVLPELFSLLPYQIFLKYNLETDGRIKSNQHTKRNFLDLN